MGWGRATETERMPRLVEGYTELDCSKWKKGKGFLNLSLANSQFTPLQEGETNRDSAFATGTH